MMESQKETNIFFDLDGVLFQYERNDYIGKEPAYAKPNYFANRPVDEQAYNLFSKIWKNKSIDGLYILSRGSSHLSEEKRIRLIEDKKENVNRCFDWFDQSHVIISDDTKANTFQRIFQRNLRKTDFLIDDYNENLIQWINQGGSAIKYINQINSPKSWYGAKIIDSIIVDIPTGEEYLYAPFVK